MPVPEAHERPIADIENQLGLPTGFLIGLIHSRRRLVVCDQVARLSGSRA